MVVKKTKPGHLHNVLFFVPLPPPYAGPELVSDILLNSTLDRLFSICHIKANFSKENARKGRTSLANVSSAFRLISSLIYHLACQRPEILYVYLCQTRLGLMRDAVIVTLGALFSAKNVMHLHGSNFAGYYQNGGMFDRFLARYVCKKVHTCIVLGDCLQDQFKKVLAEGYRVRTVYNAVDSNKLMPGISSYEQLLEHRKKNGPPLRVLFVGHHSINKGYYDFLAAIPNVVKSVSQVEFCSAGQPTVSTLRLYGMAKPIIHKQEETKRLTEIGRKFIEPHGMVYGEAKTRFFMDADIFVLPSYSEGMPIVVLEAMAAGLPVVTTPVGAIPEFFKDGKNGFIVQPGRPDEIADALIRLLKDQSLRERIGRTNFAIARDVFNPKRLSRDMAEVFKDIITAK